MTRVTVHFDGENKSAVSAARGTEHAIRGVGDESRRTHPHLKALGTLAAVGVGAAFVGLAATLKVGFGELAEGQKVAAQTGAVLKSTGGIANVTAADVGRLAQSQSRLTGIDDELIATGENLLLTFKNVRNEVGAGNQVFDRATKSALDLSVAGFGSLESTSKQLGKALNDPVRGLTALGRAGVTFSEDQKKAIESMVKTGDVLGAQKLILKEVESQVGGSAKAYGDTLPGQLAKARNSFEEIAGSVATTLLPYLTQLLDWVNTNMPTILLVIQTTLAAAVPIIAAVAGAFQQQIIPAVERTIAVISGLVGWFREHETTTTLLLAGLAALGAALLAWNAYIVITTALTKAWAAVQLLLNAVLTANPIGLVIVALVALAAGLVVAYQRSETFRQIVQAALAAVRSAAQALASFFTSTVAPAFRTAWDRMSSAVSAAWEAIRPIIAALRQIVQGLVDFVAGIITGDWARAWNGLKTAAQGGWNLFKAWITGLPALVLGWAKDIGKALIDGIISGLSGLADRFRDAAVGQIQGALDGIKGAFGIGSPSKVTAELIGKPLADGVVQGWITGSRPLPETMKEGIRNAIEAARAAVEEKRGVFAQAFQTLSNEALTAFDQLASEMETRTEKQLRRMDERASAAARNQAIAEARAALEASVGAGLSLTQAGDETPEKFAERQRAAGEAIKAAQKTLDDALAAQQRFVLEQRAAKERAALDEQNALKRRHFEEDLLALQTYAERHALSAEQLNQRLLKIFAKYGVPFKEATQNLGAALAEGLREAAVEVEKAAVAVKDAIMKHLSHIQVRVNVDVVVPDSSDGKGPKGRQHGGPVMAGVPYIVGERGPEIMVPMSAGTILPNDALRSVSRGGSSLAGGASEIHIHAHVHADGYLIGGMRELADRLATELAPRIPNVAMYESRV